MQDSQKNEEKGHDNLTDDLLSHKRGGKEDPRYISVTEGEELKSPSPFSLEQSMSQVKREKKMSQLMVQNKRLRIANREMKKQLQQFEKRLDQTLKKRTASEKKPRVAKEIVESMELKNAYKQCEIYKREVLKMKKKQEMFDEAKVQNLMNQVSEFEIQKQKLLQEIKGLKKLSKQQEKGLIELTGTSNYSKMYKQLEELKEENKKLQQKISKQDRQTKMSKMNANNQRRKVKQSQAKNNDQKKKEEEKQASQLEILKSKADRDGKKIVFLTSELNKLNSLCEEQHRTIQEKDKQIAALRLRLSVLRKQTRAKNSRLETEPTKADNNETGNMTLRSEDKSHNKQKSNLSMTQGDEPKEPKKVLGKYPRLMEAGEKKENSFKWNHHQFSSKIKEIQVSLHASGQIMEVNFRYEKGEPNQSAPKANVVKFTCEQNTGEYLKCVRGGFKDSLLRYLVVETNKCRNKKLGQIDLQPQCINFAFGEGETEYPGAFFGENSAEGINRIGCLVECIK